MSFYCERCGTPYPTLVVARMCCDRRPEGESIYDQFCRLVGPELWRVISEIELQRTEDRERCELENSTIH